MIAVTRINGTVLWLNPLMIESVESTPDTVVTLNNGHKYVLRDRPEEIAQEMKSFLGCFGIKAWQSTKGEDA